MIAYDGDCAIAIEAKKFGNVGHVSLAVEEDLKRLKEFSPMLSPMSESSVADDWWLKATQRWGLILIGSHGGDAVLNAWTVKGEEAKTILATRLANRGSRRASPTIVENAGRTIVGEGKRVTEG